MRPKESFAYTCRGSGQARQEYVDREENGGESVTQGSGFAVEAGAPATDGRERHGIGERRQKLRI